MPRKKRVAKVKVDDLSDAQFFDLCLGGRNTFENDFLRRAAYWKHKDELMELVNAGARPAAFWDYEGHERLVLREEPTGFKDRKGKPYVHKVLEDQEDALRRLGLLTAEEEAQLKAWKQITGN